MRGLLIAVMVIVLLGSFAYAGNQLILKNNALVYYWFNESASPVVDAVAGKINLTCSGTCPVFRAGQSATHAQLPYAVNFSVNTQNLTVTSNRGRLARNNSAWTLAFKFRPLSNATGTLFTIYNKNGNKQYGWEAWHNNAGTQNLLIYHQCNAGGTEYYAFTRNSFNTIKGWVSLAFVFSRSGHNTLEMWVNGTNSSALNISMTNTTGKCNTSTAGLIPSNNSKIIFGNSVAGASKLMQLDEVGVYGKALNASQIRLLHANGTFNYTSAQYDFNAGGGAPAATITMNTCQLQVDSGVIRLWSNATHSTGADIRYNYSWFANGSFVSNGTYPNIAVSWRYKNISSNITNSKSINTWGVKSPAKNMTDGRNYTYASTSGAFASGNMYLNYSLPNNNSVSWINLTYGLGLTKLAVPDACYFVNKSYLNLRVDSSNNPSSHIQVHCCLDTACAVGLTLFDDYTDAAIYEINVITRTRSVNPSSVTADNILTEIGNYTPHLFTTYYGRCTASDANGTVWSTTNSSLSYYIPIENFCIYDEMTMKKMNIAAIPDVRLDSFCANKTEKFNITANCTSLNLSCAPEYQKLWFNYNSSVLYYRSKIPGSTLIANLTWYMINLYTHSAVLMTNRITDVTGQYTSQPFYVYKNTQDNGTIEIFAQPTNLQNQVFTYLVKDETYNYAMANSAGVLRVIGNIEADQAATKLITLPPITFNPDNSVLAKDITITDYFNCSEGVWRLAFNDAQQNTDYLNITLYNGTSHTTLGHITLTPPNSYSATFSVNNLNCNETYYSDVMYCNDLIGCQPTVRKTYGGYQAPFDMGFFTDDPATLVKLKNVISACVLIGIVLLIPGEFAIAAIGLEFVAIFIFWSWGWIGWGNYLVLSMFGLILGIEAFRVAVRNR